MLSSQDEACKLEFRSETRISCHSVHSNSLFFFFNNFARRRAGKVLLLGRLRTTFHKKLFFFSGEKKFGHANVACNFGNFGHVCPCLVILRRIMFMLLSSVTVERHT